MWNGGVENWPLAKIESLYTCFRIARNALHISQGLFLVWGQLPLQNRWVDKSKAFLFWNDLIQCLLRKKKSKIKVGIWCKTFGSYLLVWFCLWEFHWSLDIWKWASDKRSCTSVWQYSISKALYQYKRQHYLWIFFLGWYFRYLPHYLSRPTSLTCAYAVDIFPLLYAVVVISNVAFSLVKISYYYYYYCGYFLYIRYLQLYARNKPLF